MRYASFDQAEIERHYNPRVAVPDFQRFLDRKAALSEDARATLGGAFDVRYGSGPLETLDVFGVAAGTSKPLQIFVHGGYWRGLDKSFYSYLARPFVAAGAVFVAINYDLCPRVPLDTLVDETLRAIRFCQETARSWGADPMRITLSGHSAGAHLAAAALHADGYRRPLPHGAIKATTLISGIYDLAPVLRVSVNAEIGLDPAMAARNTLIGMPFSTSTPLHICVGGDEPSDWIAQSEAYAAHALACGIQARFETRPGANHFSIVEALTDADDPLMRAMLEFLSL